MAGLKGVVDFLERNKTRIVLLWFLLFALYRIIRHFGLLGFIAFLDSPGPLPFGIFDAILFSASVVFLFYAYYFSSRVRERHRIVLIFLAAFFLFSAFTQLSKPGWVDAQGYYDLAVLGAEKGPLYLIENYHTLNTKWKPEFIDALKSELQRFGLYDFGMQKLRPEPGEPNRYSSRIVKHPPLWPLILSLFMIVLGTGKTTALLAVWLVSSLAVVSVYFLAKKQSNEKTAIDVAFLFMLVPSFVLSSTEPLLDTAVVLFTLLSFYFLSEGLSKNSNRHMLLSGLFCSLAFFTKFIAAFLFIIFLATILLKTGIRKSIRPGLLFLLPFFTVSGGFMLLNYYFFLTMVTAKANVFSVTGVYNKGPLIDSMLSLYYLNYFGIPLVFLVFLFAFKRISQRKNNTILYLFMLLFIGLLLFYPIKTGIERHALPFFLILLFSLTKEIGNMKPRAHFIYISAFIMILQAVLLII